MYMKLSHQYKELVELKAYINKALNQMDSDRIFTLSNELKSSEIYSKLLPKDSQLYMLSHFLHIFLREKNENVLTKENSNIFYGVDSLDTLEERFHIVEFGALRFENDFPEELCMEFIDQIIDGGFSSIAVCRIIRHETAKWRDNLIRISKALEGKGYGSKAIYLLNECMLSFPEDDEFKIILADVWIKKSCFDEAYRCLKLISNPDSQIKDIIKSLEGVIAFEKI